MLAGIVMLILGFFVVGGSRGPILIAAGLALGSIGGLELSIREHFAGYKSHTAILAGVPALIVLGLLFYARARTACRQLARAAIGIGVFAVGRGAPDPRLQQPLGRAAVQALGIVGPQAALGRLGRRRPSPAARGRVPSPGPPAGTYGGR